MFDLCETATPKKQRLERLKRILPLLFLAESAKVTLNFYLSFFATLQRFQLKNESEIIDLIVTRGNNISAIDTIAIVNTDVAHIDTARLDTTGHAESTSGDMLGVASQTRELDSHLEIGVLSLLNKVLYPCSYD